MSYQKPQRKPVLVPDHPHLHALDAVLSSRILACAHGLFALPLHDLVLYYGKKGPNTSPERIEFATHTDEEVMRLADYCEPASFGRGGEDVHDDSYRKAGKLEKGDFATTFDPVSSGLIDRFSDFLLEGHDSNETLRVELHKLNVYGPGSFFKAHKDTPRGEDMFGSLVVVYPTRHSGGTLKMRHKSRETEFDSATILSEASEPSIAYAAFYGDIEHEVAPVTSGYRVVLTYNLYLVESGRTTGHTSPSLSEAKYEQALKDAFHALMSDPEYLPNGGMVGFGLWHEYPVKTWPLRYNHDPDERSLKHLLRSMKGSDAVLVRVCNALGLRASVQMLYDDDDHTVLVPEVVDFGENASDEWIFRELHEEGHAKIVSSKFDNSDVNTVTVHWATEVEPIRVGSGTICTPYVAYGNDAWLAHIYSKLCLIVEMGAAGSRTTAI